MRAYLLLTPVVIPIIAGLLLLLLPEMKNKKNFWSYVGITLLGNSILVLANVFKREGSCTLFELTKNSSIYFKIDAIGSLFSILVMIIFTAAGIYALSYMEKKQNKKRFFGFFLILYGVLLAIDYAGNMITFYFFYELMTLVSVPLVIHDLKKESIMAGLKYLFYSLFGAYMVLFGIYFLYRNMSGLSFLGETMIRLQNSNQEGILQMAVFSMIIGFSVKAGMFPLHAWLPAAHPVAPAPASAVLSAIIVKTGVLGIIRVVYSLVGVDLIRGTWVQSIWMVLALITIFMGSMLAYREQELKKRLAYSTVSQVSYILFGLSLLTPAGFDGGIFHVCVHAFVKCGLFLIAGIIIHQTGKNKVNELRGIGKEMPITMWCFIILSISLIGIPPTGGFFSKWVLATASLQSGISILSWLGPVVLLISALLTAGYLLPICTKAFLPGEDYSYEALEKKEPSKMMLIPVIVLTGLSLLLGIFPNILANFL